MSGDFDEFNGEFNHSLKGFKIPLKENVIGKACDTPAPPGTEDIAMQQSKAHTYTSPLATVYEAPQTKFEKILPHSQQPQSQIQSQSQMKAAAATAISAINNVDNPKVKSSSLFTKPSPDGLPAELTKLFRPFCCDLCSTKLNSSASARLHYESKNHDKKINAWILLKTGEPAPKRKIMDIGPTGPNALHCDVCDLPLTSIQHAKQHYMGRKHNNVLAGRGKPGGNGYYDANNKWVRTSQIPEEDPNNRFFIGESFLKQKQSQMELADAKKPSQSLIQSETIEVPDSILNLSPPPPPIDDDVDDDDDDDAAPPGNDLYLSASDSIVIPKILKESIAELSKYCEICDINVTSKLHMRLHLNGAKHAKKLRQLGEPPHTDAPDMLAQCIISAAAATTTKTTTTTTKRKHPSTAAAAAATATATSTATATTNNESAPTSDFSVFRTPSGQYYCQICDLSVTSEVTLSQHFSSKRHIRAVSQSKRK